MRRFLSPAVVFIAIALLFSSSHAQPTPSTKTDGVLEDMLAELKKLNTNLASISNNTANVATQLAKIDLALTGQQNTPITDAATSIVTANDRIRNGQLLEGYLRALDAIAANTKR